MIKSNASAALSNPIFAVRLSAYLLRFRNGDQVSNDRGFSSTETEAGASSQMDELSEQILAITQQHFPPGALAVESQLDPAEPLNEHLVIDVQAEGSIPGILARERDWHEEVSRIIPGDSSWLRLCVYPR